jgi:hypothetical protein
MGSDMRQALSITCVIIALSYPATAQQEPSTAVPVEVAKAEFQPIAKAGIFVARTILDASPWLAPMPKELGVRVFEMM